jgi:hypothetical protein
VIVRLLRGDDQFVRLETNPSAVLFREAFEDPVRLAPAISDDFR